MGYLLIWVLVTTWGMFIGENRPSCTFMRTFVFKMLLFSTDTLIKL